MLFFRNLHSYWFFEEFPLSERYMAPKLDFLKHTYLKKRYTEKHHQYQLNDYKRKIKSKKLFMRFLIIINIFEKEEEQQKKVDYTRK